MPKSKHIEKSSLASGTKGLVSPVAPKQNDGHGASLAHTKFGDHHAENYNFTFSTDLSLVQSMSEVEGTRVHTVDLTGSTFKTTVGLNDKNVQAVLNVVQTSSDSNTASTRIYSDTDGDGQYVKNIDIQVAKVADTKLMQQKFTVNADGSVTAVTVSSDHHPKELDQTAAVLNKTTLNDVTYITKTQADGATGEYHFDIFRDDNNDGVWTEIAHGQTQASNVDTTTGAINLVGIQNYLADASAIVG